MPDWLKHRRLGPLAGRPQGTVLAAAALAIVAALLSLSELPFGIALGTYTLVVLLRATPAPPYVTSATGA